MSRPPRWAHSSRVEGATTLLVTISGAGGIVETRRVATAAYVWARRSGAPLPDVDRVCRVGRDVVVPFSAKLSGELVEQCSAGIVDLYATGGGSVLLGDNTTGVEVASVEEI